MTGTTPQGENWMEEGWEETPLSEHPTHVQVTCVPCIMCGKVSVVTMPAMAWERWQTVGLRIQDAWPEGTAQERETLISGSCSDCFSKLTREPDDPEDLNDY
jgi:hypothetical protein